jgi:hypothetical protein
MATKIREAFAGRADKPFPGSALNSAQFALQMIEGVPRVTFRRDNAPGTGPLRGDSR